MMASIILTVNVGSSSLKFAVFRANHEPARVLAGNFERVGLADAQLSVSDVAAGSEERFAVSAPDHAACVPRLMNLLADKTNLGTDTAIGHRVVHGGPHFSEPQRITLEMIAELRRLSLFAPEHLPAEIAVMEEFGRRCPQAPQVACFDTAFHHDLPRVAQLLPIPRRYFTQGVRRYGFHGLSYSYLMGELERVAGGTAAKGRIILAHLGNGASLAAVREGRCLDTTMGFTPAAGLPMSTRAGDLDPGLVAYLARAEKMSADQFNEMINAKSGLLGVSEISSDVRDLLKLEKTDTRAAEALALFCYQVKKWIGAFTAALGGLDTLVFAGGIGENSAVLRARICEGLGFLGVALDPARNDKNASVVTKNGGRVAVRVIRTDEELLIARSVFELLARRDETRPTQ